MVSSACCILSQICVQILFLLILFYLLLSLYHIFFRVRQQLMLAVCVSFTLCPTPPPHTPPAPPHPKVMKNETATCSDALPCTLVQHVRGPVNSRTVLSYLEDDDDSYRKLWSKMHSQVAQDQIPLLNRFPFCLRSSAFYSVHFFFF